MQNQIKLFTFAALNNRASISTGGNEALTEQAVTGGGDLNTKAETLP